MNKNYHTHTYRCKHAEGTDEEYVLAAIKMGFEEIGFTDHSPWPLQPLEEPRIRMSVDQLENYVISIRSLQEKYKEQISIKIGLECEYFENRMDWLKDIIRQYKLDFVIFGNHFHERDNFDLYFGRYYNRDKVLDDYLEDAIKGMESGVYSIFAHPDLFMRTYRTWDDKAEEMSRKLCRKAKECNVLLEYNLGGIRAGYFNPTYYPYYAFWEVAKEEGCKAIIGIDAHTPDDFYDETFFNEAEELLKNIGIEVTDQVEFKKVP